MRKLLQKILRILSKAVVKKYNPIVIGITGSVGKTSTKEAVFAVLKNKFNAVKNEENLNNEFGFPVAILMPGSKCNLDDYYADSKLRTLIFYFHILKNGFRLLLTKTEYPDLLVFEYSAEKPGDIDYLVEIVPSNIGIVTGIGEIPVHVEYYSGPEQVAKEKAKLVQTLSPNGLAILNHDDWVVFNMKDLSKAEVMTFGFDPHASVKASDARFFIEEIKEAAAGISFKLNYEGKSVPFRLPNALGRHQIYAALAAAAVGIHFGMNLIEIAEALEQLEFPKQRMKLMKGIKNSLIIDDSYNASPLSTHAALDTLKEFGDKAIVKGGLGRKIAVLGDMKELGIFTEKAHRLIGNLAGERAEYLFTVGPAAKFIADSAFNQLPKENIMSFGSSDEAGGYLKGFIQEGDIVLVKGSRAMKMEKIVELLI
ncbi:MAG: UDP-N-acetylmuramoyl-tripeptide--D-alanyl-D-alanine ligase [Patescibacteria group bacterium]